MARFVDLGALWRSDKGKKTYASGSISVKSLEELLGDRRVRNSDNVRIFLMDSESQKGRAPDWRLTAVIDDEDDRGRDRGRKNDDRKRDRDESRDDDRKRDRDNGGRDRESDRDRDKDRDRDRNRDRDRDRDDDRPKEKFMADNNDVPF